MTIKFSLSDYTQAKSLSKELHLNPEKTLSLFQAALSELKKPILFSVLLNDFIVLISDEYLSNVNTIATILKYAIQYNNVYAFRLILALPRLDLVLGNFIDSDKKETILMLAALYGNLDIFEISARYFMLDNINQKNILGENVLHYAIKNSNDFNKAKIIDRCLQFGADQDLLYDATTSVREKILQLKTISKQKINFIWCYQQHQQVCLKNPLAKLSNDTIKKILRFIG